MKVIFIDVDGTLLDFSGIIPESARKALKAAKAAGNKIYINTGRCKAELYENILSLDWNGLICSNSLYIEDERNVLCDKTMPEELVKDVCDWLTSRKIGFFLEGSKSILPNEYLFSESKRLLGEKCVEDLKKSFPGIMSAKELSYSGVEKINIINRREYYPDLEKTFGDKFKIGAWSRSDDGEEDMAEVTVSGANKAAGCKIILDKLNLDISDSYSFGDTAGDIPMLEFCGTGIAMGNASQAAKECADYVTDSVLEDGLLHAFEHFNLI